VTPLGKRLHSLLTRAHNNTVVVALGSKLVRIAWALLRSETAFIAGRLAAAGETGISHTALWSRGGRSAQRGGRDKAAPTPNRAPDWTPIRGQTPAPIDSPETRYVDADCSDQSAGLIGPRLVVRFEC